MSHLTTIAVLMNQSTVMRFCVVNFGKKSLRGPRGVTWLCDQMACLLCGITSTAQHSKHWFWLYWIRTRNKDQHTQCPESHKINLNVTAQGVKSVFDCCKRKHRPQTRSFPGCTTLISLFKDLELIVFVFEEQSNNKGTASIRQKMLSVKQITLGLHVRQFDKSSVFTESSCFHLSP